MTIPKEERLRQATKKIDEYEINSALGFVLCVLKEDKCKTKLLREFFDKAVEFKIPLPQIEKDCSSKKIFKTLLGSAKKFSKEKPEFIIILAQAFKAVMVKHIKQK